MSLKIFEILKLIWSLIKVSNKNFELKIRGYIKKIFFPRISLISTHIITNFSEAGITQRLYEIIKLNRPSSLKFKISAWEIGNRFRKPEKFNSGSFLSFNQNYSQTSNFHAKGNFLPSFIEKWIIICLQWIVEFLFRSYILKFSFFYFLEKYTYKAELSASVSSSFSFIK